MVSTWEEANNMHRKEQPIYLGRSNQHLWEAAASIYGKEQPTYMGRSTSIYRKEQLSYIKSPILAASVVR